MSKRERWPRIESLFHQAVALDPEGRLKFLDEQCPSELRQELEELLTADGESSTIWPIGSSGPPAEDPPRIAAYGDLKLLGQGGMGAVYLARRQDRLFEGKAFAIKVLHAHRTSRRGKQRFDTERHFLAGLDHPGIVRLYDGGELADGRPYLVMDYVDGRSLDDYCRDERLTIDERLRLFQHICGALHYAHQNLVVHRDLKPSNILVDGDGKPHLLDFGIAKRLSHAPDGERVTTGWAVPMTPAYASPEQIAGEAVTTASDLYTLGLVLFELLAGELPGSPDRDETQRSDSPRPSLRITGDATAAASDRGTTVPQLRRRLQGDLDHIVGKALRFEPSARYASARELADDIERHLANLPVLARRGSWRYSVGRWLRRHRWAVTAVCAVTLLLVLAALAGLQARRLATAEAKAAESERLIRRLVGPESDSLLPGKNLDQAVVEIFGLNLSEGSKSLLLDAVQRLYLVDDQPFEEVLELIREQERAAGRDPGLAAVSLTLGQLLYQRGHFEEAETMLSLSRNFALAAHGAGALELAPHLESHAEVLAELERYEEGVEALNRSIQLRRQSGGEQSLDLAQPLSTRATLRYLQGAYAESALAARQALEILDHHSGGAELRGQILASLSVAMMELDSSDPSGEAEASARQALELTTEVYGLAHMATLNARHNLAVVLGRSGQVEEGLAVSFENLEQAEELLGLDHPRLGYILTGIASGYRLLGQPRDCVATARRAVALRREKLPAGSFLTALSQITVAHCLADLGQNLEAVALFEASIEDIERSGVEDTHWVAGARSRLSELKAGEPK